MVGALAKVPLDTLSLISNEVPPPQNSFNLRWAYVAEIYRGAGSEGALATPLGIPRMQRSRRTNRDVKPQRREGMASAKPKNVQAPRFGIGISSQVKPLIR